MAKLVLYLVPRNNSEFVSLPTIASHVPRHLNISLDPEGVQPEKDGTHAVSY